MVWLWGLPRASMLPYNLPAPVSSKLYKECMDWKGQTNVSREYYAGLFPAPVSILIRYLGIIGWQCRSVLAFRRDRELLINHYCRGSYCDSELYYPGRPYWFDPLRYSSMIEQRWSSCSGMIYSSPIRLILCCVIRGEFVLNPRMVSIPCAGKVLIPRVDWTVSLLLGNVEERLDKVTKDTF